MMVSPISRPRGSFRGAIIWRGEGMRNEEGMVLISPGMRGKVITRSENLLAHAARKAGLHMTAGPWVLVELENGFRLVVDSRAKVEKVRKELRRGAGRPA